MTRRKPTESDAAGNDSFLDITTNIVGILIILVMVVGERAKLAPVSAEPAPPSRELRAAAAESAELEGDVHQLSAQMADVQQELARRAAERGRLSTLIAAIEQELASRRESLDKQSRTDYDLRRDLAEARRQLAMLDAQQREADGAAKPQTIEIENRPTPISKTVDGKEAVFQLIGGRLTFVPVDRLTDQFQTEMRSSVARLQSQSELVDTLGPVEGFRMRYVLQRSGPYIQLTYYEFIPISSRLGEPVDEALAPGSEFHKTLDMLSPSLYAITVFTYPDSFADFAKVKKALYDQGYRVAGWPLAEGRPIAGGPNGSKAAAE